MSEIKVNNLGYYESDVTENWAAAFAKALLEAHINGKVLNHLDGSVTKEKLEDGIYELLQSAERDSAVARDIAQKLDNTINDVAAAAESADAKADSAIIKAESTDAKVDSSVAACEEIREIANQALRNSDSASAKTDNVQNALDLATGRVATLEGKVANNILKFNVFQIKGSETFTIKPGMIALFMPSNGKTLQLFDKTNSQIISSKIGATLVFSAEINEGEYATGHNHRIIFLYQPSGSLSLLSSYHNLLDSGVYIKNTDTGNAYAYVLMREVDE